MSTSSCRPIDSAIRWDWLYPRLRALVAWSGTGTRASTGPNDSIVVTNRSARSDALVHSSAYLNDRIAFVTHPIYGYAARARWIDRSNWEQEWHTVCSGAPHRKQIPVSSLGTESLHITHSHVPRMPHPAHVFGYTASTIPDRSRSQSGIMVESRPSHSQVASDRHFGIAHIRK